MTAGMLDKRRRWCARCAQAEGCQARAGIEDSSTTCPLPSPRWTGAGFLRSVATLQLGDAVHEVTRALGLKACRGCGRRREWLNVKPAGRAQPGKV